MKNILIIATLVAASTACANKELEEKVQKLEEQNGACKSDLRSAEEAKRKLQSQLKLAQEKPATPRVNVDEVAKTLGVKPGDKLYATFDTSMGMIVTELFWEKVPKTVINFVQLAEGTKEWTDPKTGKKMVNKRLYDGTIFHRVISDFMIQGGDPLGQGTGGPGYKFEDEFDPTLKHDVPGVLSMANSGKNTNGSQFFITEKETPWLNGRHTVFGKVTEGIELVPKITHVEKSEGDRPKVDVVLKHIWIGRGTPNKKG